MKKAILGLILLFLGLPGISQAVLIDFDALPIGTIDGVDLGGVAFTGSINPAEIYLGNSYGQGYISPDNSISTRDFITDTSLTMTFVPGVFSVSFFGGDAGGDEDRFSVDVYNTSSILLSTLDTGIFGGNPYAADNFMIDNYHVMISGLGEIGSVVVRDAINAGILIDNVEFSQSVSQNPEPATMLLLGTGLVGVAGAARRRKKNQA